MIVEQVLREAVAERRALMSTCLAEIVACTDPATLTTLLAQGRQIVAEVAEIEEVLEAIADERPIGFPAPIASLLAEHQARCVRSSRAKLSP